MSKHKQNKLDKMNREQTYDEIFNKYMNFYNSSQSSSDKEKKEKQEQRERGKYVFKKIHEKGIESTNIDQLLEITIDECKLQYEVHQRIDNRVGLLFAVWGLIISVNIEQNIPLENMRLIADANQTLVSRIIRLIVLLSQIIVALSSFYYTIITLESFGYVTLSLRNKDKNFRAAVDDKYISKVRLLDTYTNMWIDNLQTIEEKNKYYNRFVLTLLLFIGLTMLGYICTYTI